MKQLKTRWTEQTDREHVLEEYPQTTSSEGELRESEWEDYNE